MLHLLFAVNVIATLFSSHPPHYQQSARTSQNKSDLKLSIGSSRHEDLSSTSLLVVAGALVQLLSPNLAVQVKAGLVKLEQC